MNLTKTSANLVVKRHYTDRPTTSTLAFLESDSEDHGRSQTVTEHKRTEKTVHFATEKLESVSEEDDSDKDSLQTSHDLISWLPSEHLYEDDTFLSETQPDTTIAAKEHLYEDDTFVSETQPDATTTAAKGSEEVTSTVQTYGTSTFIDLNSEDETRTYSEISQSEGASTSDVFSTYSDTYREWKDVTEIVKDIEELEESEYVTRADSEQLREKISDDPDDTDITTSLESDLARTQFLTAQIRRLRLGMESSPRSLNTHSNRQGDTGTGHCTRLTGPETKAQTSFCQHLITRCQNKKRGDKSLQGLSRRSNSDNVSGQLVHRSRARGQSRQSFNPSEMDGQSLQPLERSREDGQSRLPRNRSKSDGHPVRVEEFGLSSGLVERLKLSNLQYAMDKRLKELDSETKASEDFVTQHQEVEDRLVRETFIKTAQRRVQGDRMEDNIQAHLIRMHPVVWFSDFVRQLPRGDLDSYDILYHYKCQLEKQRDGEDG